MRSRIATMSSMPSTPTCRMTSSSSSSSRPISVFKSDDTRPLAALGFLTVGRRFLLDQNEIIDDRIDVVSRGLLGLTVTCARCHDHKFDPIPTEDYYSFYGIFASSTEPAELPVLDWPGAGHVGSFRRIRPQARGREDEAGRLYRVASRRGPERLHRPVLAIPEGRV